MEEFNLRELGKRIKAARKAKKKTQDDVAHAIGVSKNIVSEWERGTKQPGIMNVLNYCNFLGISLDELLEFKQQHYFLIILNEEERNTLLSMVKTCQDEIELDNLQKKLRDLECTLTDFLSRAYPIDS